MQNPLVNRDFNLNCRGQLIDLHQPAIMGIINVTPDSFYAASRQQTITAILKQAEEMITDGAAFLDVGAFSSRPGAQVVEEEEERTRLIPAVQQLHRHFPDTPLSVDTMRHSIAEEAIAAGASMINDISGGQWDPRMFETIASLQVPYVLMHMQGRPETMQKAPSYTHVTREVMDFFIRRLGQLRELGVHDVILDPGFGFGKTLDHNYQLLRELEAFRILPAPLLVGISRKSMITRVLDVSPEEALNGTSALHFQALLGGARILRVHDVAPAGEVIALWQAFSSDRS